MKTLLAALILMTTFSATASNTYKITKTLCGDIDPFIIGDACVMEVTNQYERFSLVMDSDEVYAEVGNQELVGSQISIDKSGLRVASEAEKFTLGKIVLNLRVYFIEANFVQFHFNR